MTGNYLNHFEAQFCVVETYLPATLVECTPGFLRVPVPLNLNTYCAYATSMSFPILSFHMTQIAYLTILLASIIFQIVASTLFVTLRLL